MNSEILAKENEEVVVEMAKKGNYTIKVINENAQKYITSKYDPLKEAKYFVNNIGNYNKDTVFIIYGLALGYHIIELNKKVESYNKILIIEPNENIFKKALEIEEVNEQLKQYNIYCFVGSDKYNLRQFYKTHINENNINNIIFKVFSSYDRIYCELYKQTIISYKKCLEDVQLNINTTKFYSYEFTKNVFENLKYIYKNSKITQLKKQFEHIPAIIVSGGPSLEKNIKQLKEVKGKALIIAGGRTLNTLLDNDIIPDLVVSIDPSKAVYELIKQNLSCDIPLVTLVVSQSDIVREYKGEKIFINDMNFREFINDMIGEEIGVISQGGSVANTSLSLADYMGCEPLILIGQDLAYTDDKLHADSTVCEKIEDKSNSSLSINRFEVEDVHGNKVYTDIMMMNFLIWFEVYIKEHTDKLVIDATEGGAKIKGTEIISLKETIKKYCTEEVDVKLRLEQILKENKKDKNKENLLVKLKELKEELYKVKKTALVGIKYNEKMSKYYKIACNIDIKKTLNKLDEVDEKINEYKMLPGVIASLITPITLQVYQRNEFKEKINEKDKEKGIRLAKMGLVLYKGIKESIEKLMSLLDECIKAVNEKEQI